MNSARALTRMFPVLGLLGLASFACIGGEGFNTEPEPFFEPEPAPDDFCIDASDCALFGACINNVCRETGRCESAFDCETANCVDGFCESCDEGIPCSDGEICGDGRCQPAPDFEFEIQPLLTATNCVVCHQSAAPPMPGGLVFDVGSEAIYQQLLFDPNFPRLNFEEPLLSTLITKPLREDPPDHPVGLWNAGGGEEELIRAWVAGGAPRINRCRVVFVDLIPIDCYEVAEPSNLCTALVVDDNSVNTAVTDACAACSLRFRFLEEDAQACGGVVDGGIVDGGIVDAGSVDGGSVDAGIVDGGIVDAGIVDAGIVDAG